MEQPTDAEENTWTKQRGRKLRMQRNKKLMYLGYLLNIIIVKSWSQEMQQTRTVENMYREYVDNM